MPVKLKHHLVFTLILSTLLTSCGGGSADNAQGISATTTDASTLYLSKEPDKINFATDTGENLSYPLAYNPESSRIAAGNRSNAVKEWKTDTWSLNRTLTLHTNWVSAIAYSPDKTFIATAGKDSSINILDSGTTLASSNTRYTIKTASPVYSLAFSPRGEQLAATSQSGEIYLWSYYTQQRALQTLIGHTGTVYSVQYSPDGSTLASAGADGNIILWNRMDDTSIILGQHAGPIYSILYSSDDRFLISAGADGVVKIWNLASQQLQTLATLQCCTLAI